MDATLTWEIVGAGATVAGVVVTGVIGFTQARSGRRSGSKVTAELGAGRLDPEGVLYVEFASGKTDVMTLPKPGRAASTAERNPGEAVEDSSEFSPVNAIFVRNVGRADVTVSRCHYVSDLGSVGFRFEPQPGTSRRGDHLPKRLSPGEDAVLVHDLVTMKAFLNRVLLDHGVDAATFRVVLTLGNGSEVAAFPSMEVQVDMDERELDAMGLKLVRQVLATPPEKEVRDGDGEWVTAGSRSADDERSDQSQASPNPDPSHPLGVDIRARGLRNYRTIRADGPGSLVSLACDDIMNAGTVSADQNGPGVRLADHLRVIAGNIADGAAEWDRQSADSKRYGAFAASMSGSVMGVRRPSCTTRRSGRVWRPQWPETYSSVRLPRLRLVASLVS